MREAGESAVESLVGRHSTRKRTVARSIAWVGARFGEGGGMLDLRRDGECWTLVCARDSNAQTKSLLSGKLVSDAGLFSSYNSQQGAANGEISWFFFQGSAGLCTAGCWLASQLHRFKVSTTHGPRYFNFSLCAWRPQETWAWWSKRIGAWSVRFVAEGASRRQTTTIRVDRGCSRYELIRFNEPFWHCYWSVQLVENTLIVFKRNIWTHLDLLSIPQSGGNMSKRLGGIIGCKYKPSSWHSNGFPDGINRNIGSTDSIIPRRSPPLCCTLTLIAMQGHQTKNTTKTF